MAQHVVTFVVQKLGNLLVEEAIFLNGVRDQVEWVETELRRMECFLKDADAKRRKGDERVKNWLREVTDVAYQAEDVVDTFVLTIERGRRQRGLVNSIKRYALIPSQLIACHLVGTEIVKIRAKIREISESRVTYGIANLGENGGEGNGILEARRRVAPHLDDGMDVVGFNVHRKNVVKQLLDTNTKRRCVVSIVGMGGLGKTTLAKKVYNSPEIKTNFSTCVWISVSQDYLLRDLLKSIIKKSIGSTTDEMDRMDDEELIEKLHDFLKQRTYLIVMDDIWRTDVWEQMNPALPDAMNGSRVLFTTRFVEVARCADPNIPPLQLPLLNVNDSWELFTKKAFSTGLGGEHDSCPEELKELGERFVKRCRGLPLALVVLGGLLSRKDPTPIVWLQVAESMDWESTEDGKQCMKILALSYSDLPHHYLKSCFLYIGCFPEDCEIRASKLAKLWVAEGFIPHREREVMEDTARSYLDELVQRSMIQVVRRKYDGGISRFRIHDLLRDLCLTEAKHDGFLNVYDSGVEHNVPSRRLVLHNHNLAHTSNLSHTRNIRSLFLGVYLEAIGGMRVLHSFKLLRVLELRGMKNVERLPKEIQLMTHLRYLDLGYCNSLRALPSSIGMLRNLQTLNIRNTDIWLLPKELGKLLNLRHLCLNHKCICPPISTLTKLQTLKHVQDGGWLERSLAKLTNLRRLCLIKLHQRKVLSDSLLNFNRLVSLRLLDGFVPTEAITALSNNHHLIKFCLQGWISEQRLPESKMFPPNLTKLILSGSRLKEDPMPVLEKLPNLVFLEMRKNTYMGREMVCATGGFPRLQMLILSEQEELQHWSVEEGAMPNLTCLHVRVCERLAMLPEGLQHVASLKKLVVFDSRNDFINRYKKDIGEEWYKIQHIKSTDITWYYKSQPQGAELEVFI